MYQIVHIKMSNADNATKLQNKMYCRKHSFNYNYVYLWNKKINT